jgi:flagellar biogenesis protein FliO
MKSGGGLGAWLLEKLRGRRRREPRLALLERISLAPRQSLALVEAEGRRILVATSAEGAPAFYPLDASPMDPNQGSPARAAASRPHSRRPRASW